MALEQMKSCDNVSELARELNVDRSVLYHWRDQLAGEGDGATIKSPVRELRREIRTHFNHLSTRWQELKRLWRRWKKRRKPQSHQNCSKKSPQNQDLANSQLFSFCRRSSMLSLLSAQHKLFLLQTATSEFLTWIVSFGIEGSRFEKISPNLECAKG